MKVNKRERIKINTIEAFQELVYKEGNKNLNMFFQELQVTGNVIERLYDELSVGDIAYKVNNAKDFVDYIEKIMIFKEMNNKLWEKIRDIKALIIERVEYQREFPSKDDVQAILGDIEKVRKTILKINDVKEIEILAGLEKEISKDYIYAKDIELLKRFIKSHEPINERYNEVTKTKTYEMKIPRAMNYNYIPVEKGSVEYHHHLNNNIPRLERLIRSLDNYLEPLDNGVYKINQSEVLQDSINIAVAYYNGKAFKGVSGSDEVKGYCTFQESSEEFQSYRVNKLGEIGLGYKRNKDSEKKILEEINRQIVAGDLKPIGEVILLSKWEPCSSCCLVIREFSKKYPQIKLQIKYNRNYSGDN